MTPAQHFVNWQQDPNGNWLARFVFPEKTTEFSIAVDLLADMAVINPFDFFVEPFAETFPFVYPSEFAEELAPYLDASRRARCCRRFSPSIPREPQEHRRFPGRAQSAPAARYPLPDPHGAGRADAGGDAGAQAPARAATRAWLLVQILRHLGLAARFVSGYLIQLTADLQRARRAGRHRRRTSPTCTPGPKSTCRAPAGSGSIPPPVCCAARAISRSPPRRTIRAAAPISGGVEPAEVDVLLRDERHARRREAARHLSVLRRRLGRARCARRTRSMRDLADARRPPHDGRRADLRVDRRLPVGGMEHGRARPDQARRAPTN